MTQDFRAGLDLAQLGDYSALIICERTGSGRESEFLVRYAKRWRGGQLPGGGRRGGADSGPPR
jgi:hypothetical protein